MQWHFHEPELKVMPDYHFVLSQTLLASVAINLDVLFACYNKFLGSCDRLFEGFDFRQTARNEVLDVVNWQFSFRSSRILKPSRGRQSCELAAHSPLRFKIADLWASSLSHPASEPITCWLRVRFGLEYLYSPRELRML